ncbi:unnamed protein product [Plutella xylostella]|uniref:(diamondback moth) hypothetical protein n=1 Tax=Plutella xylostella TaxID=51655 RepID=A0A8S4G389_PLUXY|nr:unnamed protein product [Plutella xylostella]
MTLYDICHGRYDCCELIKNISYEVPRRAQRRTARARRLFATVSRRTNAGLVGVLNANLYFWVAFTVLHLTTCLVMTFQIYYMGRFKLDGLVIYRGARQLLTRPLSSLTPTYTHKHIHNYGLVIYRGARQLLTRPLSSLTPTYLGRCVLLLIANAANCSLAAYGTQDILLLLQLNEIVIYRGARQLLTRPLSSLTPTYLGRCVLLLIANAANCSLAAYGQLLTRPLSSLTPTYLGRCVLLLIANAANCSLAAYGQLLTRPLSSLTPTYLGRCVLLLIANAANCSLAAYGVANHSRDFASHLLLVLMSNLFLYTLFYIVMKLLSGERIRWYSWVFIALTYSTWFTSSYFYLDQSTNWALTPAESRRSNRQCSLLQLYDSHDIWHFLSSIAMFFSFIMYLTIDDNLSDTPRNDIMVF